MSDLPAFHPDELERWRRDYANPHHVSGELRGLPLENSLKRYVLMGDPVGGFLSAVLENDLFGAVGMADERNAPEINRYVRWLYNYAPAVCKGSREARRAWQEAGGREGLAAKYVAPAPAEMALDGDYA